MKKNIFGLIVSAVYIATIIMSGKLFEKSGKEASRKYMHIMLSNWWIIAMIFFDSPVFACIGPAVFVFVNYFSYKFNLIKAMERDEGEKDGLGTVYYAITLLILAYLTFGPLKNPLIGLCAVIIMGYGDGMAAIIGKSVKSKEFKIGTSTKTLAGSCTMFLISFIILAGYLLYINMPLWYLKALVIAGIVTVLEAISIKGTDNLTVPLITAAILFIL